jgi:endonuclease/exonuclease/phosphatase family metal-dependent hydrolase
MFLAPSLTHLIHSSGTIGVNQAQWITLSGFSRGSIGTVNVYAPNLAYERLVLWETLAESLPQACQWILCGDFNMVLSSDDNSNPDGHTISDQERLAFLHLISHLQVQDFFSYPDSVKYSWDNRRRQGTRTLKRLDWFYCFSSGVPNPATHVRSYCIQGDCILSDHLPK